MNRPRIAPIGLALIVAVAAGCATAPDDLPGILRGAEGPAWSLKASQDEMVVAVSPAGKALRFAGSAGLVVGTAVDAGVNAKYRKLVRDLLDGYDTAAVFEERLGEGLARALGDDLRRVAPLGSTAGFKSRQEAEDARYRTLARSGVDVLLDLKITYGIYRPEGIMAARVLGDLHPLPKGAKLWDDKLVIWSGPVLADDKLGDPTDRVKPDVSSGLGVDEEAIEAWSSDDGAILKRRFEEVVDGTVSALLCGLGVERSAEGTYQLARLEMSRKRFQKAEDLFAAALAMAPDRVDIQTARAVNLAHSDKVDEAISMTEKTLAASPDYGPALYNLAWWYAVEKDDPASARPYYERARALGMPAGKKIEKALEKSD